MAKYHIICPQCGDEFDYNYNYLASISHFGFVMRYGAQSFSVKCPECRKRAGYNAKDKEVVI